ncbi:MAG TPA: putative cobaltochelatase [Deltaproteobacteria bacterium]|nr:putative cobaltochelatase [Deltaproteobacteria bacterium]
MDWSAKNIYPFSAIVGQETMTRALMLNAISPSLGGLLIRGEKGTAKSTAVRALAALLPEIDAVSGCPFNCDPHEYERLCPGCRAKVNRGISLTARKKRIEVVDLPLSATEDMVVGSLDLEYALKEGKRRFTPGLLAKAHRGILYIDEVNLLNDHIVDVVLDAAGMGTNVVEREGISYLHRSEFILIGTMNPEEGELRPHLLDRFGMCIEIRGIEDPDQRVSLIKLIERFDRNSSDLMEEYEALQDALSHTIIRARERVDDVRISEEMVQLCSRLAVDACVAGHRADILMRKAALTIASLEGREEVIKEDIDEAADLVLFHRKRMIPQSSRHKHEEEEKSHEESPEDEKDQEKERPERGDTKTGDTRDEEEKRGGGNQRQTEGRVSNRPILETVLPMGDPFGVKRIQVHRDRKQRKASGRRSRTRTSSKAGRYIRSTVERKNNDLALDATLRAAAPYQKERTHEHVAIAIEQSDIREKVREKRIGNFIVFVVDASGSMGAEKRMIAVKGAVLSLLLDAYQKRDKVALVAFKGDRAETLLPPTSGIELAHKLLEELPTGGRTPLCHGISLGYQIIQAALRKDPNIYPLLILISDGKTNVSQYGGKPLGEAIEAAEEIGDDSRVKSMVVDVEKKGLISFGLARQLSFHMGASYFRIEDLRSDVLVDALREGQMV